MGLSGLLSYVTCAIIRKELAIEKLFEQDSWKKNMRFRKKIDWLSTCFSEYHRE